MFVTEIAQSGVLSLYKGTYVSASLTSHTSFRPGRVIKNTWTYV